ncbi:MAG: arsenate reductase family protein [Candidatus Limnocylindrales bacterium]
MVSSAEIRVQLFGRRDSAATRQAQRFFSERRVALTFVDLAVRPIAPAELHRFVERLGARALADGEGRRWRDAGLGYLRLDDGELAERLLADQRLLKLPLCRASNEVSVGPDEAVWRSWLAPTVASRPR